MRVRAAGRGRGALSGRGGGRVRFFFLLLVLGLCVAGGWRSDVGRLAGVGVLFGVGLGVAVFFRRWASGWAGRVCLGGLAVGFAWLSGVVSEGDPALGKAGYFAFHALILGYYCIFLIVVLRRVASRDVVDEDFLGLDLWLFNIGLVCFAAYSFVQITQGALDLESVLRGLKRGLAPLSLIVLFLLVLRSAAAAEGARGGLFIWVLGALFLSGVLGAVRFGIAYELLRRASVHVEAGELEWAEEEMYYAHPFVEGLDCKTLWEMESGVEDDLRGAGVGDEEG